MAFLNVLGRSRDRFPFISFFFPFRRIAYAAQVGVWQEDIMGLEEGESMNRDEQMDTPMLLYFGGSTTSIAPVP